MESTLLKLVTCKLRSRWFMFELTWLSVWHDWFGYVECNLLWAELNLVWMVRYSWKTSNDERIDCSLVRQCKQEWSLDPDLYQILDKIITLIITIIKITLWQANKNIRSNLPIHLQLHSLRSSTPILPFCFSWTDLTIKFNDSTICP